MRSLVSAELLKLRATRSAWIPLAVALAMAVVAVVANISTVGHDGEHRGCERGGERDPGASGAAELEQFRGDQ